MGTQILAGRLRRGLAAGALAAAALGWLPGAAAAQADQRCFAETGFCIAGRIRAAWEQEGGLSTFGFPVGPQQTLSVEGQPVEGQWFERARLELHPDNPPPYDVLLGRLGDERLAQQGRDWRAFPASAPQAGCRFFPETGHNVCGAILATWEAGGLRYEGQPGLTDAERLGLWGLPLSDLREETMPDGRVRQVQWFERARLELHPENPPAYRVLGGLLGSEVRAQAQQPAPQAPAADLPPSRTCVAVPKGTRSSMSHGVRIVAGTFSFRDAVAGVQSSADDDFLTMAVLVDNRIFGGPGGQRRIFAGPASFTLVDTAGRRYAADPATEQMSGRLAAGQVRPGEARPGSLAFRIPKGATPARLVYDATAQDSGVPVVAVDLGWPGC